MEKNKHATKWWVSKNYAESRKPDVKDYTIYNCIDIKYPKCKFLEQKDRSFVGLRWEWKLTTNGHEETSWADRMF